MVSYRQFRSNFKYFLFIFIFRLFNACITHTYFQADEFWQSLEPAHLRAFGYGHLTWEWKFGLRSYAFPLFFEIGYRLCSLLTVVITKLIDCLISINLGSSLIVGLNIFDMSKPLEDQIEYFLVLYIPKLIMVVLATIGEFYTIILSRKLYLLTLDKQKDMKGQGAYNVMNITLIFTLSNFFNCFAITRTFINSFEMVLTSVALYYWDWTQGKLINSRSYSFSLFVAIFTCLQRPSNGIIWIVLGVCLLINLISQKRYQAIVDLGLKIATVFFVAFALNTMIDYYFYRELRFPIFRFIQFNFTSPLSTFYGISPWHFHIFQSVPIVLGYSIPFFTFGMASKLTISSQSYVQDPFSVIKFTSIINLLAYSCLLHKEFRFIYALQPMFTIISVFGYLKFLETFKMSQTKLFRLLKYVVPAVVILLSFTICKYHEAGSIDVMKFLHNEARLESVGFIMPCHSTPWQSYLHRNDIKDLWAITCEPPLHLLVETNASTKLESYMDESDILYDNILAFFKENFSNSIFSEPITRSVKGEYNHEWPDILVVFEHLDDIFLKNYLHGSEYKEYKRFFNTLSHWDHRREGDIIVYKRNA
ncbi:hypothetical protein TPHA_0C04630 [Tetrapisispora phaffii CBS 4417]|uniref:Mannosyltransferase n=1 Tax=Tetrapisispora phaffii (strain ATCC 24235 / CBS 4417 / NBRC 1672 / NRRL Y-8282 / UCD 70-5) TaxID=1071381 RepID=G8BQV1_TETPH|nr:hypothetical protein TPHA_0C04630 [Tetrapisispora phaffii CBS 4417]CCE62613.1 hypothetical protein TPHA_0C04630 [Tetrapisispora phaffii CBS 4417]